MTVRKRLLAIFVSGLTGVAAIACSGGGSTNPTPSGVVLGDPVPDPTATPEAIITSFEGKVQEFRLNLAINGSPQQGTAVFTRVNDFARIEIRLRPGVSAQTATIRRGQCPQPTGFEESLNLVIGGVMRQELRDVPFDSLLVGDRTLVVNVSDDSFNTFAACADLPKVE